MNRSIAYYNEASTVFHILNISAKLKVKLGKCKMKQTN
jgi:hypothetical protein